ncbi:c-type cytochrome [Thauera sp.]|uniref:c-type cytochrome n=1 Tax=Thauera sp. TaxID=1905334 RepID=UPI0039E55F72
MQRRYLVCGLALALGILPAGAVEGDAEAARSKNSMCIGCHGIEGYRTAFPTVYPVPRLGGQHPEYIMAALQVYKSGDRSHPTMQSIAGGLSEQDMADLAAYYGAQPAVPAAGSAPVQSAGNVMRGKEKSEVCAACHGPDGNSPLPTFPRIGGQHPEYLLQALLDYKAGRRKDPIMAVQVEALSKQDMADLAAWFGAQQGLYTKH